jgi:hypothetical protein
MATPVNMKKDRFFSRHRSGTMYPYILKDIKNMKLSTALSGGGPFIFQGKPDEIDPQPDIRTAAG